MWIPNNQPFMPFIFSLISPSHRWLPGHLPIYKLISPSSHITLHPVFHYLHSAMSPTTVGLMHNHSAISLFSVPLPPTWIALWPRRYQPANKDEISQWWEKAQRRCVDEVRRTEAAFGCVLHRLHTRICNAPFKQNMSLPLYTALSAVMTAWHVQ